jgi:uncharacterized cupin superfamily protein
MDLPGVAGARFQAVYPGGEGDWTWHNAPCPQFVVTLEGEGEITAGDGTSRRFGAGDIMLADDVEGRGHKFRVVSKGPRKAMVIVLKERDGGSPATELRAGVTGDLKLGP